MSNDVLMLGDSMMYRRKHPQGYGPVVKEMLSGYTVNLFREIFGYSSNARVLLEHDHRLVSKNRNTNLTGETITALRQIHRSGGNMSLETILTTPTPYRIVQFNTGLHDLQRHRKTGPDGHPIAGWDPVVSLDIYAESLRKLILLIASTGAKLLWSTTTPVDDRYAKPFRCLADVIDYNRAALEVMREHNVSVIDIYTKVAACMDSYLSDGTHFTQWGCDKIGKLVSEHILCELEK